MDLDKHLKAVNELRESATRAIAAQNADPERGIDPITLTHERRLRRLSARLEARKEKFLR